MKFINLVPNTTFAPIDFDGDVLIEDAVKWFAKPPQEVWEDKPILPLMLVAHNAWNAVGRLGISGDEFHHKITYDCPFIKGNYHYMFLPMYLFSKNVEWWVDRYAGTRKNDMKHEYMKDSSWQRKVIDDNLFKPNKIETSLLGSGYTIGTLPCDGSGKLEPVIMMLENDDYLGGLVWVWYNK